MYNSIVISCDFSTKRTGYCVFDVDKLVIYDSFSSVLPGGKVPPQTIFDTFYHKFTEIIGEYKPQYMVHEQPFFRNFKTSHALIGVLCIAELVCEQHSCQVDGGIAATSLKLWATGSGRASKEEVIERSEEWLNALRLGPRASVRAGAMNDDEADSLMVGLHWLQQESRLQGYLTNTKNI